MATRNIQDSGVADSLFSEILYRPANPPASQHILSKLPAVIIRIDPENADD
jgi:hypothetical protein